MKFLASQGWKHSVQASMLEICNDTIQDLLATSQVGGLDNGTAMTGKQYTIRHDASIRNTHISNLTIINVHGVEDTSPFLHQAAQCSTEQQLQGVLNLVDLASTNPPSNGSCGDQLRETQVSDKNLSSLTDVISAIAKKEDYIPFKNSKLTHLLQPCLAGDSKTLMFVNISPDPSSVDESLCSLRFAAKFLEKLITSQSLQLSEVVVVSEFCGTSGNFTINSTYSRNLNALMSTLSSNVTQTDGFKNASIGQNPDRIYGLFLCRGDVSLQFCQTCAAAARNAALLRCPNQKESILYYEKCMIRYSNQSILGGLQTSPALFLINPQNVSDRLDVFNRNLGDLFVGLGREASRVPNGPNSQLALRISQLFRRFMGSCSVQLICLKVIALGVLTEFVVSIYGPFTFVLPASRLNMVIPSSLN
ncbi:hypothetical protein Sjap_025345 [Stephania japonica]|uniref:Gnk2-homologous domain-containing protein n=1 Tax=Stephania japonica TaxID=461633 RepID=A0AAP0E1J4_9MAGN